MKFLPSRPAILATTLLGTASLPGCTNVVSSPSIADCAASATASTPAGADYCAGLAYALPKGQVNILAIRKKITTKETGDALDAWNKAQQLLNKLNADLDALRKKNAEAAKTASDAEKKLAELAEATLKAQIEIQTAYTNRSKQTYTTLLAAVGKWRENVSITAQPNIPDPDRRFRFVANLSHDISRDDQLQLSVLPNGLLTATTTATSEDKRPAIVADIIGTALAFASGLPRGPAPAAAAAPGAARQSPPPPLPCSDYTLNLTYDPTNADEVDRVEQALREKQSIFTMSPLPRDDVAPDSPIVRRTRDNGLFYRPQVAVDIDLKIREWSRNPACPVETPEIPALQATVPDSRIILSVPTVAGAFTKTEFAFDFDAGRPTRLMLKRPSEVAAVWNIVPTALGRYMDLLKLRISIEQSETALTKDLIANQQSVAANATNNQNAALAYAKASAALQAQIETQRLQELYNQAKLRKDLQTLAGNP